MLQSPCHINVINHSLLWTRNQTGKVLRQSHTHICIYIGKMEKESEFEYMVYLCIYSFVYRYTYINYIYS